MVRIRKNAPSFNCMPMVVLAITGFVMIGIVVLFYMMQRKTLETFNVEPSKDFPVILFTEENFGGTSKPMRNNSELAQQTRFWVKSAKILPGFKLKAQHNCNGTVKTGEFEGQVPRFDLCGWVGMFKNETSKFEIVANPTPSTLNPVVLFTELNYGGEATFCKNSDDLAAYKGWIRSMKLLPGKRLIVQHDCNGTTKSKAFTANTANFDPCGWSGIFKNNSSKFTLIDDIQPSDAFPVVLYSMRDYGGVPTAVSMASAPNVNQYVYSVRIKDGYSLVLKNHQCISAPGGCGNSAVLKFKEWNASNPNFSPCSDDLKCYGITVTPGTLQITVARPWTDILSTVSTLRRDMVEWTSSIGFPFTSTYVSGRNGILVGYFPSVSTETPLFPLLNEETPPSAARPGLYREDIVRSINCNTMVVMIDRIGDGDSGYTYTYDKATYPTVFSSGSLATVLSTLKAPGGVITLVNENGRPLFPLRIRPSHVVKIYLENR